jgi:hypothetical protein
MAVTNNADPSRLGQINKAGDDKALFLKKFSGEVMTTFETTCVMKDKQLVQTISNGKSAQFPVTGTAAAAYHTPGQNILEGDNGLLSKIGKNEKVISIDGLLTASAFIANIDEAMNHYDTRAIYTTELGRALAYAWDKRSLQALVLAARASATITGGNGGSVLSKGATVATTGAVLAAAIFEAAQKLDEKDVPENDRYCVVRPAQYFLLAQTTDVINKQWGGSGVYADGTVLKVAGISIIKSNFLPKTNISAVTGENNTYSGDYSDTTAVVFQKGAIGTVKLLELATDMDYLTTHQGTLMVSKYAVGTGILRPEASVEISKA